jgi:hypothetical protein
MTTNYQLAQDILSTDIPLTRANFARKAQVLATLAVADALTRQTEEVLQPAGFAVLDEWETPEGELFDWPSAIIEALGEFHDEEMCDGPEDLIKEIEVVRLLEQQYYKALVALEANSNRIIYQALQGE